MKHVTRCVLVGLFLAATVAVYVGCENDDSSDTDTDLRISPTSVSFDASAVTNVQLSVTGGTPGYTWSVDDALLGQVVGAGDIAIYTSTTNTGQNFVTVTDGASNSVSATITQQ